MLVLTSVVDLPHQTSVTDTILCASLLASPEHTLNDVTHPTHSAAN